MCVCVKHYQKFDTGPTLGAPKHCQLQYMSDILEKICEELKHVIIENKDQIGCHLRKNPYK